MGRANAAKKAKKKAQKKASKLKSEDNVIATTKTTTLPRRGQNQTTARRKEPKERRTQDSRSDEDSDEGDGAKSPAAGTRANKRRGSVGLPEPTPPKQKRRTSTRSAEKEASKDKTSSAVKPRKAEKPAMEATAKEEPDSGDDGVDNGKVVGGANGAADVEEAGGVDADSDDAESNGESDLQSDAAADVEPSSSPKRKRDAMTPRIRIPKGGEEKYWMTHTRKVIQDWAPAENKPQFLYLPQSPAQTGSLLMINSDLNLQEMAVSRGGVEKYAIARAELFNHHQKKAKTQLNRSIVLALTTDTAENQVAVNVMNGRGGEMRLHDCMSHLADVPALAALFASDHLYTDEVLHAKWVGLFTGGEVYGMKRINPFTRLDQIVDVNYEAHARFEMVSRLSYQGFAHLYKDKDLEERASGFRRIRKQVRKDRLNNLEAAEKKRLEGTEEKDDEANRLQALRSGGLAETTDDSDGF
jgi:hypothetical protein